MHLECKEENKFPIGMQLVCSYSTDTYRKGVEDGQNLLCGLTRDGWAGVRVPTFSKDWWGQLPPSWQRGDTASQAS